MARILIADDDGHIREVVRYALEKAGHCVIEASDGQAALELFYSGEQLDLAVLDIVMPRKDGIEVCRELISKSHLPIIFLSSRDEEIDRVVGLEMGADDYITKPFSPRELVARIKAVLRRLEPKPGLSPSQTLCHKGLQLNLDKHRCMLNEVEIEMTPTEFSILETLIGRPGKVYSRDELKNRAYGQDRYVTDRTIDSHVRRIRAKLEKYQTQAIVETVHGIGYRLKE